MTFSFFKLLELATLVVGKAVVGVVVVGNVVEKLEEVGVGPKEILQDAKEVIKKIPKAIFFNFIILFILYFVIVSSF